MQFFAQQIFGRGAGVGVGALRHFVIRDSGLEEAKQAYDTLPESAPQSEADARWERLRTAQKQWNEAKDALTKALQQQR